MDEQEQNAFNDFAEMFGSLIDLTLSALDNASLSSEDSSNEELINQILDCIAQNKLPDEMVTEGASIICDLEQNPYFGEEDSDKYTFHHAGRLCKLKRNKNNKSWLAYVEYIHSSHYDEMPVEVHGGLTYGDGHELGMDFAHFNDLVPGHYLFKCKWNNFNSKYRDYDYVRKEVESLAEQLNELPEADGVSDSDLSDEVADDLPELVIEN